jgi:hypothetical protein
VLTLENIDYNGVLTVLTLQNIDHHVTCVNHDVLTCVNVWALDNIDYCGVLTCVNVCGHLRMILDSSFQMCDSAGDSDIPQGMTGWNGLWCWNRSTPLCCLLSNYIILSPTWNVWHQNIFTCVVFLPKSWAACMIWKKWTTYDVGENVDFFEFRYQFITVIWWCT